MNALTPTPRQAVLRKLVKSCLVSAIQIQTNFEED